jgi:multiple sugar transport system permease protein
MIRETAFNRSVRWILTIGLLIVYMFPIYWMLVTALQPNGGYAGDRTPHVIPKSVTLESFDFILSRPGFLQQFLNSSVVAVTTTIIASALATMAGYGFSRFRFAGRDALIIGILVFQMIPKVLLVVPYFMFMRSLGLLSTHAGLILAYTSFALPFSIWILVGFFDAIPGELDECALVDGATRFQAFYKIVLPLAAPGIAATALFAFILAWQEYLFSLVLAIKPESALLPQGLAGMIQEWVTLYEPMMAGAILTIIPVIVVYFALERHFVSGLTAGAVKG